MQVQLKMYSYVTVDLSLGESSNNKKRDSQGRPIRNYAEIDKNIHKLYGFDTNWFINDREWID